MEFAAFLAGSVVFFVKSLVNAPQFFLSVNYIVGNGIGFMAGMILVGIVVIYLVGALIQVLVGLAYVLLYRAIVGQWVGDSEQYWLAKEIFAKFELKEGYEIPSEFYYPF